MTRGHESFGGQILGADNDSWYLVRRETKALSLVELGTLECGQAAQSRKKR